MLVSPSYLNDNILCTLLLPCFFHLTLQPGDSTMQCIDIVFIPFSSHLVFPFVDFSIFPYSNDFLLLDSLFVSVFCYKLVS